MFRALFSGIKSIRQGMSVFTSHSDHWHWYNSMIFFFMTHLFDE